ncbi:MAG TPA: response regulator [Verrucomicrobiae bacterium]|nr:response regulator [Verrucomicrobiae bacterium]
MYIQDDRSRESETPDHTIEQPTRQVGVRRVLVVEDEPAIRQLNMAMLSAAGYEVDGACDGAAGWIALQLEKYDVLVTDNRMPNLTGLELVKQVHEFNPKLPIVMATGTPPNLGFAKDYEVKPVILLKPYSWDKLLNAVASALEPAGS